MRISLNNRLIGGYLQSTNLRLIKRDKERNIYMEKIEVCGKTVEEAVQNGAAQLGVQVDDVEFEVLEEAQKGGLFKKAIQAKVLVTKKMTDSARAIKFLDGIFERVNVPVSSEITRDDDKICINLITSNSSFIIGYRGEVLDALQCLAGAVANIGREEYKRVVVDCENYREKRESTLNALAEKLAEKAVRTGRRINLEPMNPFERRIIHTALSTNTEVKTESEGKEPNRYIVIVPNVILNEKPLIARRSKNVGRKTTVYNINFGTERRKSSYRGGKIKGGYRGGRDSEYRGKRDNRGYNNNGGSSIYGKPKDKSNITSYGTFIGNSQKND